MMSVKERKEITSDATLTAHEGLLHNTNST